MIFESVSELGSKCSVAMVYVESECLSGESEKVKKILKKRNVQALLRFYGGVVGVLCWGCVLSGGRN